MRGAGLQMSIGLASYRRGDTLSQLLSHADLALSKAIAQGKSPVLEAVNAVLHPVTDLAGWRDRLGAALDAKRLTLRTFPVKRTTVENCCIGKRRCACASNATENGCVPASS